MSPAEILRSIDSLVELEQLRRLEDVVRGLRTSPALEVRALVPDLLSVFERFPFEENHGIFWSIVHLVEAAPDYERPLLDSALRSPGEFTLLMLSRLLNSGAPEIASAQIRDVLGLFDEPRSTHARPNSRHPTWMPPELEPRTRRFAPPDLGRGRYG